MSLSSRRFGRALRAAAVAGAAAAGTTAGAAEVYYQPIVTLSTAYNTNVDLEPNIRQSAEGYFADAATNIGIATRQSDTFLQPRLVYNYYPSAAQRNRLEEFLNLNSRYSWQRDRFNVVGFFEHRDDINAQQPSAEVNPVNPEVGNTTPATGQARVGTTRNYLILDPTFTHLLTPLSSLVLAGEYQRLTYSPDNTTGHLNFNYYQGRIAYAKTLDLRSDFSVGVFGSKYLSQSIDSHSTSGGIQLTGGYNWTQQIRSSLTAQYQRTKFEELDPRVINDTSNAWAATFGTTYKGQISSYGASIGRTIYPSAAGGLYTTDQIRGQYDRELTQRLHFTGALRLFRDRTTTGVASDNSRNYLTGNVRMQYMLSPTIFVAGAYTYVYQKYSNSIDSADTNIVMLSFGYRGLERQQR